MGVTNVFVITLFSTFIITRLVTHYLDGYRKRPKTVTGAIRKRTPLDFHHIHIGALILIFSVPLAINYGVSFPRAIWLGVGVSLVADQISNIFLLKKKNYFSWQSIALATITHLIIAGWVLFAKP